MRTHHNLLLMALVLPMASTALASTTWYVNGVSGSDRNNCKLSSAACKTIGHAISLASSGDSIRVAAATYAEHLTVPVSLKIIGANARTTIVDAKSSGTIGILSTGLRVTLASLTIRGGSGGGVSNAGTLTITNCTISGNRGRLGAVSTTQAH